jgi:hypothetical protein
MLPRDLQWAEDNPASFPTPQSVNIGGYNQPLDPDLSPRHTGVPLFSTDLDRDPVHYPYGYDVQVALLRTRYYYAKYMVYRPFIYKALHFPEQMTQVDAEGVAECLRVRSITIAFLVTSMLITKTVMSEMATHTFPDVPAETTNTLPVLLVPKLPRYSPNLPHDAA